MKLSDVVVGGRYTVKVSGVLAEVRVTELKEIPPTGKLFPVTPKTSAYRWEPKKGITLELAEESPPVGESASQRLAEMRGLARSFAAETRGPQGKAWQLRC